MELFRNNIKSKKALNASIKEKIEPPSISKLKKTAYALLLLLLALVSSEYGVILSQYADIADNLNLVEYGYERQTLLMKIIYNIGKLLYYSNMSSIDFSASNPTVNISRVHIENELNKLYSIQNEISLIKIKLSSTANYFILQRASFYIFLKTLHQIRRIIIKRKCTSLSQRLFSN